MHHRVRTALVTGGARGIGRAVVLRLAAEGYRIAFTYKTSEAEAHALAAELNARGTFCMALRCDGANAIEVEGAYRRVKAAFGFVDTLINNAGVALYKLHGDCRETDYNFVFDNNMRAAFHFCRAFAGDMVSERFGRIVNISSVLAHSGGSMETLYAASKAALIGYTKALSNELAPSAVLVNSVSPGLIDTAMNARMTAADTQAFLSEVPLGRIGTPEEVAAAVSLLCADPSFITGADIPVNGGLH